MLALAGGISGQSLQFSTTTYSAGAGATGTNTVAVADFNRDGALDVIASNSTTVPASGSPNYTGWFGQFTGSKPNGQLQATGTAIPFNFQFGDSNTTLDRALNVVAAKLPTTNGVANFPSIFGADGGATTHINRGVRGQVATNPATSNTTFATGIGYSQTIVPGAHTNWVAAADLNGDGVDDAVATHTGDASSTPTGDIAVYPGVTVGGTVLPGLNNSTTFVLPNSLTGFSVTAGDLNGDGKADLVVATNTTSIVIYRSTATSNPIAMTFATPVIVSGLAANSQYITIADVNGDHKPDIIISTGTTSVIVLPNDGSGGFSAGTAFTLTLSAGTSLSSAVADLSRDGFADIAVADGIQIEVFRGQGGNNFAAPISVSAVAANPVYVVAADMNSDGKTDLVVASKSDNMVAVMLNTTNTISAMPNSLTFYATAGAGNPPTQVVATSFSAGGSATYALSSDTGGTGNWLSTANTTSGPVTVSVNTTGLTANVYHGVVTLTAGPFNAAKILVTLNLATPSGTLINSAFPNPSFSELGFVVVGDFNNDGKQDVVTYSGFNNGTACTGNNNIPAIIFIGGNGDGTFASTANQITTCITQNGFQNMLLGAAGDFNGDGNLDIAMLENGGNAMQIAFGDGAGHFTIGQSQFPVPGGGSLGSARAIYAADMNNDGLMDVVALTVDGNNLQGHVPLYLNDGTGRNFTVTDNVVSANFGNSRPGTIADFNGDGFLDVVVANIGTNNLSFVPGTGSGTMGTATTIPSCSGPLSVSSGDFDKDGKFDLVVGCNTTPSVEVHRGTGNGTFQTGTLVSIGTGTAQSLLTGDFDGDGNLDLFFIKGSSTLDVMLGDGTGSFVASTDTAFSISTGLVPLVPPVDLNGDGRLDAIIPLSGSIAERLGDKAATTTSVSSNPLNTAPSGQSVAFTATTNVTAPAWAKANGLTTINDTTDGQIGQGNAVAGVFTVNAALSAGSHTLSDVYAGDSRTKPANSTSNYSFIVTAGAHLAFTTQPPLNTAAGASITNFVVTVQDASNATVTGSTASISLTLNSGTFSSGQTTVSAIAGVATFTGIKINTAGTYTITAAATNITSANSNSFNITAGAATSFTVAGFPSPTIAGVPHTFTVTAKDVGGNIATGYTGTVQLTSSDAQATLPANYTFTGVDAGVHTFSGTLKTVGTRSITATDTVSSSITGTQSNITVNAGASTNVTPSGTPQSVVVGNFYSPISVLVTDAVGNPIPNASVTFQSSNAGAVVTFNGSLSQTLTTNASGVATPATPLAGFVSGPVAVTATVNSITANFSLTNLADVPTFMTITGGDAQSATINTNFPNPLKVTVMDTHENLVIGAPVTFTAPGSGASGKFPSNQLSVIVNTDANGVATSPVFTANGTIGNYQVVASTPGNPGQPASNTPASSSPANRFRARVRPAGPVQQLVTATFNLTNLGIPTMTIFAGNNQSATVGTAFATALAVKVFDAQQNPAQGVAVTFAPPASGAGGAFTGPVTVNTNASGIATAPTYTANTIAGSDAPKATATLSGTPLTATFALTNLPGAATTMTPSGTPQNAVILTAYGTALSVKITDTFGNGVPGQTVLFTAPATGATGTFPGASATATVSTDASGNAAAPTFTANATLGAFTVTATSGGLSASFRLTNIVASVGITAVSGSGQLTPPSQSFGNALTARVFDVNGNGVPNASVTFTLPSSGPSGTFAGGGLTFTANTNSQGLVTTPAVTANNAAGSFSVTATTIPNLSTTFVLSIGSPAPLTVSPLLLIFNAEVGQAPPKAQFINVQAPAQDYRFIADQPWLKVIVLPNGVLRDTLVVTVDHSALPPGHYDGNIIINDGAAIVRVDLQVASKPILVPSARSLSFQYTQGQGIPSEQVVYLTADTRNFNVTVTEVYVSPDGVSGWLKVVGDGTTTTPSPLHVTIVPDSLPPGTYVANIHVVASDATNSPMDIPVTMVINAATQQ
jgi:hypothetical protein